MTRLLGSLFVTLLLASTTIAHAGANPEQKCQADRHKAAAKYASCHQKVMSKLFKEGLTAFLKGWDKLGKCRTKYAAVWPKLQKKALGTGSTCDQDRFEDNLDGTVTDWLTGLQWEQKTDDGSVHDRDNTYSWSAASPYIAADGTVFTSFLETLNTPGSCLAGECDWRLPSALELPTTLLPEPFPCPTSPCIDEALFGAMPVVNSFWTSKSGYTPGSVTLLEQAWSVGYQVGTLDPSPKSGLHGARGVRGGL